VERQDSHPRLLGEQERLKPRVGHNPQVGDNTMGTKTPVATPKKNAPSSAARVVVDATKHKGASRLNIPTRELAGFAANDENAPTSALYPRDPSLDPQLVWKGKDEQDRNPLEVPAIPIYIQEKIHPLALIEDLRVRVMDCKERQLDLFADFNGLDDFAKKVDFYHHDQHWTNRMILGDSLLVMTSLAEKERLKGQVQMIYLDPPYGIKYGSNWQVSTRKRDVKDAKAEDTTRQPEQIKAFRDTWQYGIHSYLPTLRDRLTVARDLLTESGSIFVQIGDENVHLVRSLLDEVFGSENAVLAIIVKKTGSTTPTEAVNDYLLWYAKKRSAMRARPLYVKRSQPEDDPKFNTLISPLGDQIRISRVSPQVISSYLSKGYEWARVNYPLVNPEHRPTRKDHFVWNGKTFHCGKGRHWSFDPETAMPRLALAGRVFDGGGNSLGGVMK
jgi:adenine-specific DNA-methyltransferase